MSELFPELDKDLCYFLLRNQITVETADHAAVATLTTLKALGIVVVEENQYIRCAFRDDYDFTSRPDMDCQGKIDVASTDMVCPDCGYPVGDIEGKTKFTEHLVTLHQAGIESYLEKIMMSLESVNQIEKAEDSVIGIQFQDGKNLTVTWPEYASPRLQAGLFFAEPTLYVINSPIDKPTSTVLEATQYILLADILIEGSSDFEQKLQLAATPIHGRVELAEIETKFDEMLNRHDKRRWQFFEQDFIPALVRHISHNPALVHQYLDKLKRLSTTIFGFFHVPVGGAGLPDMIAINKFDLINQFVEGSNLGECKLYQGTSRLTYEQVIKTNGHLDMNFAGEGFAVMYVSTDNIVSTAWSTMLKLKRPNGRWKIIIIPKTLLLELIYELEATNLLDM